MADITVRGAGILGLSAAWACLCRGAQVRVIDPAGVATGSSGGFLGALAPHTPENWNAKKAFQLDSLLRAEGFWRDVVAASGIDTGYWKSGRIQPLMDDRAVELARQREVGARAHWGDAAIWRVTDAPGDWAPLSPTGLYVHDTLSAQILPRAACQSLAGAIVARGGEVLGEGADKGQVIWATGWRGLEDLSDALGRAIGNGVKGQAIRLHFDAPDAAPQLFADGLHIVSHGRGDIAVGSTTERAFDDPKATDAQADALYERVVAHLPVLNGARIAERWAGVRPRTATRAPLIDRWPERPDHFVLNGGFKIGLGMAPKLAECMADLVLEGREAAPEDFRFPALFEKAKPLSK